MVEGNTQKAVFCVSMVRVHPDNPLSGGIPASHIYLHMEANYRIGALLTNQVHCYVFLLTNITLKTRV